MKACSLAILIGLLSLASCAQRKYSESELRSLLIGSWDTSTSFETKEADTRISLKSHGKITFNEDGTLITESASLMDISVPEGRLPVEYDSVVHGKWSISDQTLSTSRTSEEVTARDDVSRKFIEREEMTKLRSESPTNSVYSFKRISPRKIVTLDSYGSRTTFTRKE